MAMHFQIAVQLASIPQPLGQAIGIARRLGVSAVELEVRPPLTPRELGQTGRRHLRKLISEAELRISCLSFATRRGYQTTEGLDRRVAATKEALELAYALGTNLVVNRIGRIPVESDPSRAMLTEALLDIGRHGQRCGAMLAARTGSEPGEELNAFLQTLPDGTVGVDFDPASLVVQGHSVADALQALARRVVHVHARDAVYDLGQGHGVEVPLGRGIVDFDHLVGTLAGCEFRGYFTIERRSGANVVQELDDAVAFLRSLQQD